ncbi:MAG: winged helix-turn-helix transcriptional regulator [Chthonomonadaceae bacterium]|nr:winged helix-turn-helix transcriptional regulator [Chthonomonadaceae bacterium]
MDVALDPFMCLANPIRRSVLDHLILGPLNVDELWTKVSQTRKLSRSSFSEHLAVLRNARMVTVSIRRTERLYELSPDGFTPVFDWVSHYEAFWDDKLSNLSTYLSKKEIHENP